MKQYFLILVSLFLSVALEVSHAAGFSDVASGSPYFDAIEFMKKEGIVQGYPDGTYKPDKLLSRAEFAKILVETYPDPTVVAHEDTCLERQPVEEDFSDVPRDSWFAKYVCQAGQLGLVNGYPDRTFQPVKSINFVEAAKMIILALYQSPGNEDPWHADPWYRIYVENLAGQHAIPTSISSFGHYVSRGEIAEIIYRLKSGIENKTSHTYAELE